MRITFDVQGFAEDVDVAKGADQYVIERLENTFTAKSPESTDIIWALGQLCSLLQNDLVTGIQMTIEKNEPPT
jgi:hypothetical protein